METPARFTFSPDGSTTVFQIPVQMKGDNYVRIDIDNTTINDRNKFDIVNNAIVFVSAADVPSGSLLDVLVVQTDEGIANLGNTTSIDIVAQNINSVNTVGTDIAAVVNNSNNMAAIQTVNANMPAVVNAVQAAANAATSETNAALSESNAAASEAAAQASKDTVLATLDNFDDRYLGQKPSDPVVDNDGDPLVVGTLYFNTTTSGMKVYNGSSWDAAYAATAQFATAAQGALADTAVQATAPTGSAKIPVGTTAERDSTPTVGLLRFNSTDISFEGWDGLAWGSIGGGASGGGTDAIFYENDQTVTADYTIAADKNAMTTGPVEISTGVTVTIETGARWVVI